MAALAVSDELAPWVLAAYALGVRLAKQADDAPEVAYNLAGTLYLSDGGWLLLSIPNALARGLFSAMREPGVELPPGKDGAAFNAHCSVMRPSEIASIGGPEKITERGKQFHYTTGRLYELDPAGWPEMAKAWVLRLHSPELQALRRSYGLSGLPNDGKYDFHVTVAVRRRSVLGRNEASKAAA